MQYQYSVCDVIICGVHNNCKHQYIWRALQLSARCSASSGVLTEITVLSGVRTASLILSYRILPKLSLLHIILCFLQNCIFIYLKTHKWQSTGTAFSSNVFVHRLNWLALVRLEVFELHRWKIPWIMLNKVMHRNLLCARSVISKNLQKQVLF